jgi:hemolysin activation/secretion protein
MRMTKVIKLTLALSCSPNEVLASELIAAQERLSLQATASRTLITQQQTPNQQTHPIPTPLDADPALDQPQPIPSPTQTDPEQSIIISNLCRGESLESVVNSMSPSLMDTISDIKIEGYSRKLEDDINQVRERCLRSLRGKTIASADIEIVRRAIADVFTRFYIDAGYLTSRAEAADLAAGVLTIRITEGTLPETIEQNGETRENIMIDWVDERPRPRLTNYVRQRILQGIDEPLRLSDLEDQLRLLRADETLFTNVDANLGFSGEAPGAGIAGISQLKVELEAADPWQFGLSFDNYSPPGVGSERATASLGYRSLLTPGDSIAIAYSRTFAGGADVVDVNYRIPVNPSDGSIQLRAAFDWTQLTDSQFDELGISGESQTYELTFRQPVIRTPREEFALALGFSYRNGQSFILDRIPSAQRASVIRFTQEYVNRSIGGAWIVRSQFNFGLDLLNSTVSNSEPDSRFFSWLGQAQRAQRLNQNNLLLISTDIQLTPHLLPSSEQFLLGGGQSLRGYSQNALGGDNGVRFSLEDRIILESVAGKPRIQLAPFIDLGWVWNHADRQAALEQNLLASVGLGFLWEPITDLNVRLDYAFPFVELDNKGNNLQEEGIYFSVNYGF